MPFISAITSPSSPYSTRRSSLGFGAAAFSVSPSIGGFSTWIFSEMGNLDTTTPNNYTLTALNTFYLNVQCFGAGGISAYSSGAPGGLSSGRVLFSLGYTYVMVVGSSGTGDTWSAGPYGGGGRGWNVALSGAGGGFTGLFVGSITQSNSIIIAGGGGGGHGVDSPSFNGDAGAGGGLSGNGGAGTGGGAGGTQVSGYGQLQGGPGGIRSVNQGSGGGGGGGYWGGFGGAQGGFGAWRGAGGYRRWYHRYRDLHRGRHPPYCCDSDSRGPDHQ